MRNEPKTHGFGRWFIMYKQGAITAGIETLGTVHIAGFHSRDGYYIPVDQIIQATYIGDADVD